MRASGPDSESACHSGVFHASSRAPFTVLRISQIGENPRRGFGDEAVIPTHGASCKRSMFRNSEGKLRALARRAHEWPPFGLNGPTTPFSVPHKN